MIYKNKIIYYVLGHIWPQIWYLIIIELETLFLKMHYKPIHEGHMCNLIFEKDLNLTISGSSYCDGTHVINQNATFWNTNIQNNNRGKNKK
jgi:hypothetical protein